MNPRFVQWLRSRGETVESFRTRDERGELTRVIDAEVGREVIWTVVFLSWVTARWKDYATEAGCRSVDEVRRAGFGPGFDPWLVDWVTFEVSR